MALPASPNLISMDLIRAELGLPAQAPFDMNTARSGGYVPLNPYSPSLPPSAGTVSLASWHSYCHTCTTLYTFTVYKAGNMYPQGWSSAAAACSGYTSGVAWTVVSSSSTLTVGSTLYTLQSGVYITWSLATDAGNLWAFDATGNKPIRMTAGDSNVIAEVGTCAPAYTTFTARYNNDSSTICFAGTNTVYTSGGWGIGTVIYTDTGLTTPLTGYNYIVNTATNIIYEINNATGAIQLDTGLTC